MTEKERYERAKRRVRALRGFYGHLAIYALIMALLFFIDVSGGEDWWFHWAAIGWGFAVAVHGISIFAFGPGWEEKKIRETMEKEKEQ